MMKYKTRVLSFGLCLFSYAVHPLPSYAVPPQDRDYNDTPTNLETIVVSATKTAEKIEDVPVSISVIEGKDLTDSGNRVIQDALHLIPGIALNDVSGNGSKTMITMRGMPNSNSQYILVLLDGVPQNTPSDVVRWGNIPMENVERVEVIKGPASTLYGMNAMGGVINIITKRPIAQQETILSAGYGSYKENKQNISVSGITDKFEYTVGGIRYQSDGWRDENNSFERYNVYGKFSRDFNTDHSITLNLGFSHWKNDFPESIQYDDYQAGRYDLGIYDHGKEKNIQSDNALIYEYRLDEKQKLTNKLYTQWVENEWTDIVDVVDQDNKSFRIGDEIQYELTSNFLDRENRMVLGYQYEHQGDEVMRQFSRYFPVASRVGQKYIDNDSTRQIHGAYFQDMIHLSDQFILSAGLRYDYVDFTYKNLLSPELSGGDSMDQLSPKIGLTFKLNSNYSFYANIGTGFKTPTASQVARYLDLNPEKTLSYETGLKGNLFENMYFTLSLYHTDMEDQLSYLADPLDPSGYRFTNAGKSKIEGAEFELNLFPANGFQLFAAYNYNKSEFIEFYDYNLGIDYAGNDFAWQPRHKISGGITYKHHSGVKASLTTIWLGKQYLSNANEYSQDSYFLTDLSVSYTMNSFEFALDVRNIFDKQYASYGENWGYGDVFLTEGDPVTFFGKATYRF
jgi:iron complex outermembrane recepter protein